MEEKRRNKTRSNVHELECLLRKNSRWSPLSKCDQVYPGIYIGGLEAAQDVNFLSRYGITYILNAASGEFGNSMKFSCMKTHEEYYAKKNFKCEFMGVAAVDVNYFQLHPYFVEAAEFIHKALTSNEKILVHCFMGKSRSATLVIAYLMIKKNMTVADAVRLVRSEREIFPNDGFIRQLCDLEERLIEQERSPQNKL